MSPPRPGRPPEAPDLALLVAAWPVVVTPLLCGADKLASVTGLLPFLLFLVTAGLLCSGWLAGRPVRRSALSAVVALAALGLGFAALAADQQALRETLSWRWLMNAGIDGQAVVYLICAIAWISSFRCFVLLTDLDVLLSLGFSLALFILLSLVEPDGKVVGWLVAYGAASLYLLLHYRGRKLRRQASLVVGDRPGRELRLELRTLVGLGVGVALTAGALSVAMAQTGLQGGMLNIMRSGLVGRVAAWFEELSGQNEQRPQRYMDVAGRVGELSEDIVFRVTGDAPELWRGLVYAGYDGRNWVRSRLPQKDLTRVSPALHLLDGQANHDPGSRRLRRFRLVLAQPTRLLHNVPRLVAVRLRGYHVRGDRAQVLTTWPMMQRETAYELLVAPADDASWQAAPPTPAERRSLLQLPSRLPQRVRSQAWEAIAGARSPMTRMDRLSNWLAAAKYYTLRPDPIPDGVDVVDWFIHEMDAGWCRHFAASLAVMGRCVGVPTRLVEGYLTGEIEGGSSPSMVVRRRDAHVWVEAWIDGRGWVTYDPTSAAEDHPEGLDVLLGAWQRRLDDLWLMLPSWTTEALSGAGLLLALAWYRRRLQRRRRRRRPSAADPAALRAWRQALRLLLRAGLRRSESEPELVFAHRAASERPELRGALLDLAALVTRGRYRGQPLDPAELQALRDHLAAVAAAVRGGRRRPPANPTHRHADDR